MVTEIEDKIDRLTRLVGTDEGFYMFALHSFIEYYLRYEKSYGDGPRFPELTWAFREELLLQNGETFIEGLSCLGRLGKQHYFANKVRHSFEKMDPEEATAATYLFLSFCRLAGIDRLKNINLLEKNLDAWKDRSSLIEKNTVISTMQQELKSLQSKNRNLLEQRKEYESLKSQAAELRVKITQYDVELQKTQEIAERRDERLDKLRKERNDLNLERNRLIEDMARFAELEKYLGYLGRLSLYTRTRMDYERTISELTPEQEQVVSGIKLKKDSLIKGGAGTGKSLVLIECLRRAVMQNELELGKDESVVLVTFTRTLAKYNRYIAELKEMILPLDVISTVDELFLRKLKKLYPDVSYDYDLLESYFTREMTPEFFEPEEMISEIENYLFASDITEKEYIEELIPRNGMRRRLSCEQRQQVWQNRCEFIRHMESSRTYTRDYGRYKLLQYLREHHEDNEIRDVSYLFLDEVQDLTPVALMILRELTRGAMIMAGDTDQSLYNFQSPFARANISLRGTTRILKTNFRNTRQIHELAENFRKRCPNAQWENQTRAFTFREGPVPELYTADTAEELRTLLVEKISVFIEELGYDPENICILVPRNREIMVIQESLKEQGFESVNIVSDEFTFEDAGKIRISTLHSSKGLDFPVVFLYLPYLHRRKHYNDEETEKLLRNLVYVGMTRAMDDVNAFVLERDDPVLNNIVQSFGK